MTEKLHALAEPSVTEFKILEFLKKGTQSDECIREKIKGSPVLRSKALDLLLEKKLVTKEEKLSKETLPGFEMTEAHYTITGMGRKVIRSCYQIARHVSEVERLKKRPG